MSDANAIGRGGAAGPVISISLMAELSEEERAAFGELQRAVYPPEEEANWAGASMEWARAHWQVGVSAPGGALACHVGMLLRAGAYDDERVKIAGVGGVSTHPLYRRRGYAEEAMRSADGFFRARGDVDFGLLVCDPPLLAYYAKLGWQEFNGRLLVTQFGEQAEFTYSPIMTLPIRRPAPTVGVIDLEGPPW